MAENDEDDDGKDGIGSPSSLNRLDMPNVPVCLITQWSVANLGWCGIVSH